MTLRGAPRRRGRGKERSLGRTSCHTLSKQPVRTKASVSFSLVPPPCPTTQSTSVPTVHGRHQRPLERAEALLREQQKAASESPSPDDTASDNAPKKQSQQTPKKKPAAGLKKKPQPQQEQQQQSTTERAEGAEANDNSMQQMTLPPGKHDITKDVAMQPLQGGKKQLSQAIGDDALKEIDDQREATKGDDKQSLQIKISLDLDVEVHLSARVKGDITIGLL